MVALYPSDLHWSERAGHVVIRAGKGAKERSVPLSRQARHDLQAYYPVRPPLPQAAFFLSQAGHALHARDIQRFVKKAASQAGIPHSVTPHLLRHTFATRALQQGKMDLATLSAILGHENLTTTARYLHPHRSQVTAMMEDL